MPDDKNTQQVESLKQQVDFLQSTNAKLRGLKDTAESQRAQAQQQLKLLCEDHQRLTTVNMQLIKETDEFWKMYEVLGQKTQRENDTLRAQLAQKDAEISALRAQLPRAPSQAANRGSPSNNISNIWNTTQDSITRLPHAVYEYYPNHTASLHR